MQELSCFLLGMDHSLLNKGPFLRPSCKHRGKDMFLGIVLKEVKEQSRKENVLGLKVERGISLSLLKIWYPVAGTTWQRNILGSL